MFCSSKGFLVKPSDMFGVIGVKDLTLAVLLPGDDVSPFNAVLGLARDGGQSTEGNRGPGSVHVELAFDAGG